VICSTVRGIFQLRFKGLNRLAMNDTQIKCLLVMIVLALIGFGPLSLTCLIGLFVVITRPRWFYLGVQNLYRDLNGQACRPLDVPANCATSNLARINALVWLLILLLLDVAPVPVTGTIGLYVVIARPKWFKAWVEKIYLGDKAKMALR
jgi:hypothetical protein